MVFVIKNLCEKNKKTNKKQKGTKQGKHKKSNQNFFVAALLINDDQLPNMQEH